MQVIDGAASDRPVKLACVIARYYQDISDAMLAGVRRRWESAGQSEDDLTVIWVPGAVEIPITAQKCAESGQYDAVVCLGLVVKGETAHFEYVSSQCSEGCQQVALKYTLPVVFGVLTTYNQEQALARVGGAKGHVGVEVVETALHMVSVLRQLSHASAA